MQIIGYILLVGSGITLALIGGGGAILSVPVLVYFFKMDPLQATTYSLFIVAISSAMGAFKYAQQKFIDLKIAIEFSLPCFISIYLVRSFVLPSIPISFDWISFHWSRDIAIMIPFSIIMGYSSFKALSKKSSLDMQVNKPQRILPKRILIVAQGFIVGAITGFIGVGGGFLITPILHFFLGLNFKRAVGTSLFVITLNSLFGFFVDMSKGITVSYSQITLLSIASVVGLAIGLQLSKHIKEAQLKTIFSILIGVIAMSVFIDYSIKFIKINIGLL